MQSLLDRKLLVITGKGGVGKTTMAAAIGMLAARSGRRTIVVELGEQSRLTDLFGVPTPAPGVESKLEPHLWSISIDPDRALLEWLQALGGRVSGRLLASSGTFQYFTAAAPGAKELVSMVKIAKLAREPGRRRGSGYDLVVLDGPATGHALGLLRSPQTFGAIARIGPIAGQTKQIQELLEDRSRSAYLGVALATEMAVTETIELQDGLREAVGRGLEAVIVNGLLPRRFSTAELDQVARVARVSDGAGTSAPSRSGAPSQGASAESVVRSAARAARTVHERSRREHNQLARLRRRELEVIGAPFIWGESLGLPGVREIAERIARRL
jgi:Anion-transporting ATPase